MLNVYRTPTEIQYCVPPEIWKPRSWNSSLYAATTFPPIVAENPSGMILVAMNGPFRAVPCSW